MYTNAELADVHFMYGWTHGNTIEARRLYEKRFPNRRIAERSMFIRIYSNICESGSARPSRIGQAKPRLMLSTLVVLIALTLPLLFLFLYFHVTRYFSYWKNMNVPYIKPIPLFGNIFRVCTLQKSIGELALEIYKSTKSPYIGFFVFDQPFLLIRDPELIKLILVKDFDNFDERSVVENLRDDEMGSSILFMIKNPAWRQLRTKVSPAFSIAKLKSMVPLMVAASEELNDHLNTVAIKSKSIDSRDLCMKYTTNVIASCAFGIDAYAFQSEDASFRIVSKRVFDWNISRATQMASYFFAPMLVNLFRMKFLDSLSANIMREAFWKTLNERERSGGHRGDLIDVLIQIRKQHDDNKYLLSGDKLVAQAAMFFIAGYQSAGSTISFTLYEISLQPVIQNRLREEIESILNKHGKISYEAVEEMVYLDMVICETLRKYPLLPHLDRRCVKDYQVPGTDLVIKKGMPVYISLFGLHFDPQYFSDPESYDPERFSPENRSAIPPYTYMPFGEGHHNCIGEKFALLSSKIGLIQILLNFKVEVCKDTQVPLQLDTKGILLAPKDGLRLRFTPFKKSI